MKRLLLFLIIHWFGQISSGCSDGKKYTERQHSTKKQSSNCRDVFTKKWLTDELTSFKESRYTVSGAWIYSEIENCLSQVPQNLKKFAEIQWFAIKEDHSMGFELPDAKYFETAPPYAAKLPEELSNIDFLISLDQHQEDSGSKALEYIEKLNQKRGVDEKILAIIFDSQFLVTADESQTTKRFLVYYPTNQAVHFVQFGLHDNLNELYSNSISMITVEKEKTRNLEKQEPMSTKAWFQDFWRVRNNNDIQISTRLKQTGSLENCYKCHSSAVMPIVPEESTFDSQKFRSTLKTINNKIKKLALAEATWTKRKHYGPPIGPVNSAIRNDALFSFCAPELNPEEIKNVRSSMNCEGCHNDMNKTALRFPMTNLSQIERGSILKVYVEDLNTMPPNNSLSDVERRALTKCLTEEYFGFSGRVEGVFEKWLKKDG